MDQGKKKFNGSTELSLCLYSHLFLITLDIIKIDIDISLYSGRRLVRMRRGPKKGSFLPINVERANSQGANGQCKIPTLFLFVEGFFVRRGSTVVLRNNPQAVETSLMKLALHL